MGKIWKLIRNYSSSPFSFSTLLIILANGFIIYDFIFNNLKPEQVFFIYLIQSMILFFFFGILILSLNKLTGIDNKQYSGKGLRTARLIFAIFFWIFYGIAYGVLMQTVIDIRLDLGVFIAIALFFLSYLISFIKSFNSERERLGSISMTKVFFEPAIIILPIYIAIIIGVILGGTIAFMGLIILKIWADIIANSPLNAQEPFVYALLKLRKR